jgi:uncharacterized protein (DUF1800 family)
MRQVTFLSGALAALLTSVACSSVAPGGALGGALGGAPGGALGRAFGRRELSPAEQGEQALNRLTFGPRPGDSALVARDGVDRWIERQLYPEAIPDSALNGVLATQAIAPFNAGQLAVAYPQQDVFIRELRTQRHVPGNQQFTMDAGDSAMFKRVNDKATALVNEYQAARMMRAQLSERQLQEVMTDFWENHFSVFNGKMPTRFSLLQYDRDVIRPRALGKFRALIGAVAHSAAMLYYLDNIQNGADSLHLTMPEYQQLVKSGLRPVVKRHGALNENYGRELLELHSLGVDGGYTQQDVINVARALTGWTLLAPREGGGYIFRPGQHDANEKLVLGHTLKAGRGEEDGEEVLDIIARHPATAHYIALKLARRFVADTPSAVLVDRAAAVFAKTGGDIREVVRTIVTSPEFFARLAFRSKVKTPFEFVASIRRAVNAPVDTTVRSVQAAARLGQPLWGHLTPNGWPDTADQWVNTGSLLNRINLATQVSNGGFPGITKPMAAGFDFSTPAFQRR